MVLGLAPRGGNYVTVKRYIQVLGLDTSHWLGQSWVGKRGTPPTLRPLASILVQNSDYATSWLRKRLIDAGLKEHRCEECRLTEWQGKPIPLEVDHLNGIANDHRIDNLRLLCPNCHALTPTWRGRNKQRRRRNTT
ncbi:HNH endonuclease [Streptomyces sp. NPDC094153]|uniref:HNH endonuclease n=1 Tax=Streptomyces sp. NPDC094153 TaxID=3366058 RepID=UPI0037FB3FB2